MLGTTELYFRNIIKVIPILTKSEKVTDWIVQKRKINLTIIIRVYQILHFLLLHPTPSVLIWTSNIFPSLTLILKLEIW